MWETSRLGIAPLALADASELVAALDHPEVGTYIGGPDVTTVAALRTRIGHLLAGPQGPGRAEIWLNYVVRLRADSQVIGRLEATVHGQWAEVAWVFGRSFWGYGYATEGARWLVDHLEREHDVAELWATVDPRNQRSIALLNRLDFASQPTPARRDLGSFDEGDLVFARTSH